jgi:hypothetical protein
MQFNDSTFLELRIPYKSPTGDETKMKQNLDKDKQQGKPKNRTGEARR